MQCTALTPTEVKTAAAEPELIILGKQLKPAQCSSALHAPVDPTVDAGITSKYSQDTVRDPECIEQRNSWGLREELEVTVQNISTVHGEADQGTEAS